MPGNVALPNSILHAPRQNAPTAVPSASSSGSASLGYYPEIKQQVDNFKYLSGWDRSTTTLLKAVADQFHSNQKIDERFHGELVAFDGRKNFLEAPVYFQDFFSKVAVELERAPEHYQALLSSHSARQAVAPTLTQNSHSGPKEGDKKQALLIFHNPAKEMYKLDKMRIGLAIPDGNIVVVPEGGRDAALAKAANLQYNGIILHSGHSMYSEKHDERRFGGMLKRESPAEFYTELKNKMSENGAVQPTSILLMNCYAGNSELMEQVSLVFSKSTTVYGPRSKINATNGAKIGLTGLKLGAQPWSNISAPDSKSEEGMWSAYSAGEMITQPTVVNIKGLRHSQVNIPKKTTFTFSEPIDTWGRTTPPPLKHNPFVDVAKINSYFKYMISPQEASSLKREAKAAAAAAALSKPVVSIAEAAASSRRTAPRANQAVTPRPGTSRAGPAEVSRPARPAASRAAPAVNSRPTAPGGVSTRHPTSSDNARTGSANNEPVKPLVPDGNWWEIPTPLSRD